jgi:geranylgeranyl diphosphate synthase type II
VTLETRLATYRARVEACLERCLPPEDRRPERLHAAMRYAVLGGGKRVRPLLVYLTGEALGIPTARLDGPSVAVELIHAYSLVHDDLPAMDDDDLRRGRPTCHRAFDDATAILAGDALQVLAFQLLATDEAMVADFRKRLAIVEELATASGTAGMAGGQAIDLWAQGRSMDVETLETMHRLKTGALIRASVLMGAWSADDLPEGTIGALAAFGDAIGLAFQIQDDILDVEGETNTLGKTAGSDRARDKPNYPSVAGMEAAKRRAGELCDAAIASLSGMGPGADPLREMARYIVARPY